MKNHILASLLFATTTSTVIAQQSTLISIGGGLSNSSSDTKNRAYTGNGYNLQADVFFPFLHSNAVNGDSKFALGITAGGLYYSSKNLTPDAGSTEAAYKLYSGQLDITSQKGGASNNGFTATAGLQAAFTLGRFSLSPSFSGGYFSLKQKGFVQEAMVNAKPVALVGSPETKHTGFIMIPQVRVSYPLAANLHLYASTALLMGPEISTQQLMLVPEGGVNDQHTYEPSQLSAGKMQSNTVQTNYRALNINAGISLGFGTASRRLRGKVTKPGDNGAKKEVKNPLYNAGGHSQENPMNGASIAMPGNPIGGIIVKGGKNPGGGMTNLTVSNNGIIQFDVLEAGNYKFIIQTPEDPAQQKTKKNKVEKATSGLKDTLKTNV